MIFKMLALERLAESDVLAPGGVVRPLRPKAVEQCPSRYIGMQWVSMQSWSAKFSGVTGSGLCLHSWLDARLISIFFRALFASSASEASLFGHCFAVLHV